MMHSCCLVEQGISCGLILMTLRRGRYAIAPCKGQHHDKASFSETAFASSGDALTFRLVVGGGAVA
eukprot:2894931-Amphidinium_carterae.1